MENLTNVTTGKVRLSYVHVFKPYAYQPGQEEKFQVTILVPKTDMDTMNRINVAIEAVSREGFQINGTECVLQSFRLRYTTEME